MDTFRVANDSSTKRFNMTSASGALNKQPIHCRRESRRRGDETKLDSYVTGVNVDNMMGKK